METNAAEESKTKQTDANIKTTKSIRQFTSENNYMEWDNEEKPIKDDPLDGNEMNGKNQFECVMIQSNDFIEVTYQFCFL